MKRIIYSFLLTFLAAPFLFSQTFSASGTVKSSVDNMPLPGVNIVVKNSSNGTVSDFDGNFTLSNVSPRSVLVLTYLGFETQELVASTNMEILLKEDSEALDEVVLIGYGSKSKKDLTGSVSMVKSETIEKLKPLDVSQALQGRASGVSVTSSSGSPGSGFRILIRGVSSNSDNDPLVVVDGYIASMNSINPDDIESLTVLKDAQAAIYGIEGANGVILVTTKKGSKNTAPKVSYNVYAGVQETSKQLSLLNNVEYAALLNESYAANGESLPFPNLNNLGSNTDWQDNLFDTANITNHNISLSGGTDNVTYYLGASHLDQEGIIASDKSNFVRDNVKLSLGIDISEKLTTTLNLNYFANSRRTINESGLGSVLFNAISYSPLFTLNQEDLGGLFGNEIINPFSQIRDTYNSYFGNSIEGNFQLEYKMIEGLTATTRLGFKSYNDKAKNFSPIVNYGAGKVFNTDRSTVSQNKQQYNSYTWDTFLNYKNTFFNNHTAEVTVGMAVTKDWGDGLFATGYDVPNNSWDFADIALTTGTNDARETGSYTYDNRLLSYFGRLQYDYKGKYFLSAMLRRDASSAFDTDYRVDHFKSVTAGWKISDEAFLKDTTFINFLKLRASYGTLGNLVGSDLYRATLSGEATYVFDNALTNGTALGPLPNPVASWETAEKYDIGLDAQLFGNKIEIVADYFSEDRVDLLVPGLPFSGILGATAPGSGTPVVNAGTTRTKGFELMLKYSDALSDNLSFDVGYNITQLEGEVISINSDVALEGGSFGIGQLAPSRMEVGQPIGYFYGLQTDGIFQTQAEVDAHPSQAGLGNTAQPGDLRFVDVNQDGTIDANDRTFIGKPLPDYIMGFNLAIDYKNFDFSAYAYAELGKDMVRNYERDQPNVNRLDYYLDRWTGPGTSNEVPRATTGATSNKLFSDFFVEDASFLRIQTIQLGYTFPQSSYEGVALSKVRLYASVNNAFTFSKYKGFDPAATSGNALGGGIDPGFYPVTRQYLIGLNISF
ncbi:MAG: SusC/RagA family TonB-linked outer membrane protein [Flavobacteriaceae bacterium]|tara:strand:+ start:10384 stop:13398 length:3015 start_codon:yes stop_codon:yes gene_type:complete